MAEFEMTDAVVLVTQTSPTSISYLVKDRPSGKLQSWTGEVTADHFTWTVEAKPGVVTRMTYRRVGDLMGGWKLAAFGDLSEHMDALGVPPAVQRAMEQERPTERFTYLGKGLWEMATDSKILAFEPTICRYAM